MKGLAGGGQALRALGSSLRVEKTNTRHGREGRRADWPVIFRDGCSIVAELDASSANVTLTILVGLNLELRTLHDSLWIT